MKKFLALVMALAMVLSLAACGTPSTEEPANSTAPETTPASTDAVDATGTPAAEPTSTDGSSVTFYYPMFYNVFDPSIQPDYDYALWYSTLWCMDYDAGGEANKTTAISYTDLAGDVAESWEVAPDFTSVSVTIKKGVTFQTLSGDYDYYGGRELTATDVAYSYQRLLGQVDGLEAVDVSDYGWVSTASTASGPDAAGPDVAAPDAGGPDAAGPDVAGPDAAGPDAGGPGGGPGGPGGSSGALDMIDSIEVVDDYNLVFHLNTSDETNVDSFMTTPVNLCGPEWDALTADQQTDWHYACGTGAYILTNYVQDQSMSFVRNENYYGTVNVENITLVYIADNTNITSQLTAGTLDWVGEKSSVNVLTLDQIKSLETVDTLKEYVYNGSAPAGIGLRVTQEPFNNKDLRIALQQLINLDDVATYLGMSGDVTISGLWNVNSDWSATEKIQAELAEEYAYNPDAAVAVLESYGYSPENPLEITVALDPLADQTLFTYIQSVYATYGVNLTLDVYDDVMAQSMVVADATSTEAFNFTAGGLDTLMQAQLMTMEGGFGYGFFYDDTTYPELINNLAAAPTLAEQAEIAQEADFYFTSQHWVIAIGGVQTETEFMSSRIGNYDGQKVYGNGNMRVVLRNITVAE